MDAVRCHNDTTLRLRGCHVVCNSSGVGAGVPLPAESELARRLVAVNVFFNNQMGVYEAPSADGALPVALPLFTAQAEALERMRLLV
jgi:hypothetical protein